MKKDKRVGLALSCGGWRGLSYVGVIKELERMGVEIDVIVGSSAGAMIGGMYALGQGIGEIEEYFLKLRYRDLLRAFSDPFARTGLFKGEKTEKYLRDLLGEVRIEDLSIEFAAVATNILRGESVVIDKGDLVSAVRASGSLPFIFEPVEHRGVKLVDGGASMPIPVEVVKNMGVDVVIAVNPYGNLFSGLEEGGRSLSRLEMVKLTYYSVMSRLAFENAKQADVVLEPKIKEGSFGIFRKFVDNPTVIEDGVRAVVESEERIKNMCI